MLQQLRLTMSAPAKVNLGLCVSSNVQNGRHMLRTVMHTISLADTLTMSAELASTQPSVALQMSSKHNCKQQQIPTEDNLVYKAIMAFCEVIGQPLQHNISIQLEKAAPAQSGLGMGSSDCAQAIKFMAQLFEVSPVGEQASDVAAMLGSDIAFFLQGGCSLLGNFGEQKQESFRSFNLPLVIARPQNGCPTGAVYREFDAQRAMLSALEIRQKQASDNAAFDALLQVLRTGDSDPYIIAPLLMNNLQQAACAVEPQVCDTLSAIRQTRGVLNAMVSGSGSACLGICANEQDAKSAAQYLIKQGFWAVAVHML